MIYVVKAGDTAASIAAEYGVSADRLVYDNQIRNETSLVVGQALLILIPEIVHQVMPGETLTRIAAAYGVTVTDIIRNNPFILDSGILGTGETLVIRYRPEEEGEGYENPRVLNGYLYPFAEGYIIGQSMPYLTGMYLFSYGFTLDGALILPAGQENWLMMAKTLGVERVLVLTPLTESGTFNSNQVSALVNDPQLQETLTQNLLEEMEKQGYGALDVDFEFVPPKDRDAYVEFLRRLTERMHAAGYPVSVALVPKTSDDQQGDLYQGIDYGAIGEVADSVLVMAYEWGYTFGPPMAVAPLDQVTRVVDYAVSRIAPAKIDLGIPNYGYDWQLPYERGASRARVLGNVEAVYLAARTGSEIQFDEQALSPYFYYTENGREHMVWFEDVRSMRERFRLIARYGLRGAGYWNLMRPFRANWLLWNATFRTVPGETAG
ncbi:MAG: LysM peptidoglycan-binding domain-containing protein [Lachnospiraceae bacterium]|nr:LysM peptidoglycan-binding domain-containing protein [Lachnospiraceae bacterium]